MAHSAAQKSDSQRPSSNANRHDPEAHPQASAPDPTGRRKFQRTDIQLEVSLSVAERVAAGRTENLSPGGVFVATDFLLQVGQEIDVTITLPNDRKIVAHGQVRWVRERSAASAAPAGMGIQFEQIEGRPLVESFLSAHPPAP